VSKRIPNIYADGLEPNELITYINISNLGRNRETLRRFTFNWASSHWRIYKEIDYIPNVYYYSMKAWEPIIRIANGTDSITFALLYMTQEQGEHIPFIAKLLINHGPEFVKFIVVDIAV
jgi:hypothetical protein